MPSDKRAVAPSRVSTKHVRQLADELAQAAGLTRPEAERVLDVLHVKQLVENTKTLQRLLASNANIAALGVSRAHAQERLAAASADSLRLANLRVGVKAPSLSSILV